MIQKIKDRIRETALWKWGGETSRNGVNALAYLILFAFAFYAQVQTYDISKDNNRNSRAVAEQALAISSIQSDLIYQIQLGDYNDCQRISENQTNVKEYNQRLLDYASSAGVDVGPLYEQLENLYVSPSECIVPVKIVPEG